MGSWGFKPFDSDDAGDFFDPIYHRLIRQIERTNAARKYPEDTYNTTRAAIEGLLRLQTGFHGFKKEAVYALKRMLQDSEWIDSWKTPSSIRSTIEDQLYRVMHTRGD